MKEKLTKEQALAKVKQYKEERKVHTDRKCGCEKEGNHKLIIDNYNEMLHSLIRQYLNK